MYPKCPKCGHAPLPADQSLPAACPACGIILAKFGVTAVPGRTGAGRATSSVADGAQPQEEAESVFDRVAATLTHVPARVSPLFWKLRIGMLLVFALWTASILRAVDVAAGDAGSSFLHLILTPFHEAGHVALSWAGSFLHYLGGTLGQLAMPVVLAGALLLQRRDPFGASLFGWMLGFSVIDMGIYMYDAYDPHLMLLTGYTGAESDNHDWIQIFGDLGLLNHARGIGSSSAVLGRMLMIGSLAWAAWLLWKQHERLSDSPLAEEEP